MIYFQVLGRRPTAAQTAVVDACLVTLMEHGLTPRAPSRPGSSTRARKKRCRRAVAAGLLAVGSRFVGTDRGRRRAASSDVARGRDGAEAEARRDPRSAQDREPRAARLRPSLSTSPTTRARRCCSRSRAAHGMAGAHVNAALTLAAAVDATYGHHITLNVTGAIAAAARRRRRAARDPARLRTDRALRRPRRPRPRGAARSRRCAPSGSADRASPTTRENRKGRRSTCTRRRRRAARCDSSSTKRRST